MNSFIIPIIHLFIISCIYPFSFLFSPVPLPSISKWWLEIKTIVFWLHSCFTFRFCSNSRYSLHHRRIIILLHVAVECGESRQGMIDRNWNFITTNVEVRYWILSHPDFLIISYFCEIHFSIVAPKIVVGWLALLLLTRCIPEFYARPGSRLFWLGLQVAFSFSPGYEAHHFQFIIHTLLSSSKL